MMTTFLDMRFKLHIGLDDTYQFKFIKLDTETLAGPIHWNEVFLFENNLWTFTRSASYYNDSTTDFDVEKSITNTGDYLDIVIHFPIINNTEDPFYNFKIKINYNKKTEETTISEVHSKNDVLYFKNISAPSIIYKNND